MIAQYLPYHSATPSVLTYSGIAPQAKTCCFWTSNLLPPNARKDISGMAMDGSMRGIGSNCPNLEKKMARRNRWRSANCRNTTSISLNRALGSTVDTFSDWHHILVVSLKFRISLRSSTLTVMIPIISLFSTDESRSCCRPSCRDFRRTSTFDPVLMSCNSRSVRRSLSISRDRAQDTRQKLGTRHWLLRPGWSDIAFIWRFIQPACSHCSDRWKSSQSAL